MNNETNGCAGQKFGICVFKLRKHIACSLKCMRCLILQFSLLKGNNADDNTTITLKTEREREV